MERPARNSAAAAVNRSFKPVIRPTWSATCVSHLGLPPSSATSRSRVNAKTPKKHRNLSLISGVTFRTEPLSPLAAPTEEGETGFPQGVPTSNCVFACAGSRKIGTKIVDTCWKLHYRWYAHFYRGLVPARSGLPSIRCKFCFWLRPTLILFGIMIASMPTDGFVLHTLKLETGDRNDHLQIAR